jgi:hypothetical protein
MFLCLPIWTGLQKYIPWAPLGLILYYSVPQRFVVLLFFLRIKSSTWRRLVSRDVLTLHKLSMAHAKAITSDEQRGTSQRAHFFQDLISRRIAKPAQNFFPVFLRRQVARSACVFPYATASFTSALPPPRPLRPRGIRPLITLILPPPFCVRLAPLPSARRALSRVLLGSGGSTRPEVSCRGVLCFVRLGVW